MIYKIKQSLLLLGLLLLVWLYILLLIILYPFIILVIMFLKKPKFNIYSDMIYNSIPKLPKP